MSQNEFQEYVTRMVEQQGQELRLMRGEIASKDAVIQQLQATISGLHVGADPTPSTPTTLKASGSRKSGLKPLLPAQKEKGKRSVIIFQL